MFRRTTAASGASRVYTNPKPSRPASVRRRQRMNSRCSITHGPKRIVCGSGARTVTTATLSMRSGKVERVVGRREHDRAVGRDDGVVLVADAAVQALLVDAGLGDDHVRLADHVRAARN